MLLDFMDDIHLEHHQDGGREFLAGLYRPEVEVLALGGDVTNYGDLDWSLPLLHKSYPNAQIVYTKGNHEFYGGTVEKALRCFDRAAKKFPFVHFLEPGVEVMIQRHRFIGATMWFGNWDPKLEGMLNDFTAIQCQAKGGFRTWVKQKNEEWVDFYAKSGQPGDIVVTHHIPSWNAIDPHFARSPINCFYVCDVEDLIIKNQPKLWLHGHSHTPIDIQIGDTRVIRNPFGYPSEARAFWAPKEIIL